MFLHVSIEGERLYDDFLVYLRGIEQMECTSLPHGDADMRGVQSLLVGDDDDDVAVTDDVAQQAMVVELGLMYCICLPVMLCSILIMPGSHSRWRSSMA